MILQRILSVIRFLASRGLAFRGSEDRLGSKHNGNYLGLLELLAEFDPCLKSHIDKYGKRAVDQYHISAKIFAMNLSKF